MTVKRRRRVTLPESTTMAILKRGPRDGAAGPPVSGAQLTVSVPFMPAASWPGTEQ